MEAGERCTDPFLLRAKQSIIPRKAFQFQVCTYSVFYLRMNPSIGSFSLVKQKNPKRWGGGCTDLLWAKSGGSPSRRWLLISCPVFSFAGLKQHIVDRTGLLGFTTKSIPFFFLNRTAIFCHHSRTGPLHPGMQRCTHAALRVTKKKKEKKENMHKLQAANCTLHSQPLTSNE